MFYSTDDTPPSPETSNRLYDRRVGLPSSHLPHLTVPDNISRAVTLAEDEPFTPLESPPVNFLDGKTMLDTNDDDADEDEDEDIWAVVEQRARTSPELDSGSITDMYSDSDTESVVNNDIQRRSWTPTYSPDDRDGNIAEQELPMEKDLWAVLGDDSSSSDETDNDQETAETLSSAPSDDLWNSLGIISDSSSDDESDTESTSDNVTVTSAQLTSPPSLQSMTISPLPTLHTTLLTFPDSNINMTMSAEPTTPTTTPFTSDLSASTFSFSSAHIDGSIQPTATDLTVPNIAAATQQISSNVLLIAEPTQVADLSLSSYSVIPPQTPSPIPLVPVTSTTTETSPSRIRSHSVPEGLDASTLWYFYVQHWRKKHAESNDDSNTETDVNKKESSPTSLPADIVAAATPSITLTMDDQSVSTTPLEPDTDTTDHFETEDKTKPIKPKRPPRPSRTRSLPLVDAQGVLAHSKASQSSSPKGKLTSWLTIWFTLSLPLMSLFVYSLVSKSI